MLASPALHRRLPASITLAWLVASCGGTEQTLLSEGDQRGDAATAFVDSGGLRCDAGFQSFFPDRDGDGYGTWDGLAIEGCAMSEPPVGFVPDGRDCDDNDPRVQLTQLIDADGDGFGADGEWMCTSSQAPGLTTNRGDCDDGDPTRSPNAIEQWFDGRDDNCDGFDNPQGCIMPRAGDYVYERILDAPVLADIPVERDLGCVGPDLYFAVIGTCTSCGGTDLMLAVANRGSTAATFRVRTDNGAVTDFVDVPLQGVSAWLSLESSSGRILLTIEFANVFEGSDCTPEDNSIELETAYVDC